MTIRDQNLPKLLVSQYREAVAFGAPHRGPTRHAGAATSLASLWQCAQQRAASDLSVSSSLDEIPSNMHVFRPVQGYTRMLGIIRLPLIAPRRSDGFCPTRCRSLMPSIIIRRGQSVQWPMQLSAQQACPVEDVSDLKIELHASTIAWAH